MPNQLHAEVTSVVNILEVLAHGVVATNVPENHEVMKAVIIQAVLQLELILAIEDEIQAATAILDDPFFG